MVEMYDSHTKDRLVHLLVAFVVLIHYFFEQHCLPLQLFIRLRYEDVLAALVGQGVLGWNSVCLQRHLYLLQQVVGNMMVWVVFKIGLVFIVGLEVNLVIL